MKSHPCIFISLLKLFTLFCEGCVASMRLILLSKKCLKNFAHLYKKTYFTSNLKIFLYFSEFKGEILNLISHTHNRNTLPIRFKTSIHSRKNSIFSFRLSIKNQPFLSPLSHKQLNYPRLKNRRTATRHQVTISWRVHFLIKHSSVETLKPIRKGLSGMWYSEVHFLNPFRL